MTHYNQNLRPSAGRPDRFYLQDRFGGSTAGTMQATMVKTTSVKNITPTPGNEAKENET